MTGIDFDNLTTEDRIGWMTREHNKAINLRPVWHNEVFRRHSSVSLEYQFAHIAETDPTMLAYTPSIEYGRADRQIKCKPGRYLSKFFGDVLTPKQIQAYAQWWATCTKPEDEVASKATLGFACSADDIADVYDRGPRSCMAGDFRKDATPVRVYAAGDLAIAYLELPGGEDEAGKVIARALAWPEKKTFGRVYPTPSQWRGDYKSEQEAYSAQIALFNRLKSEGYTHVGEQSSVFDGARLLKIEVDTDEYAMPYLDSNYGVCDSGEYWTMSRRYEHACDGTNGVLQMRNTNLRECDLCCAEYDSQNEGSVVYSRWPRSARGEHVVCDDCVNDRAFYCEGSLENYLTEEAPRIEAYGVFYNQDWAEDHGFYLSEVSDTWFRENDDPQAELADGTICSQAEKDEREPEGSEDSSFIETFNQEQFAL